MGHGFVYPIIVSKFVDKSALNKILTAFSLGRLVIACKLFLENIPRYQFVTIIYYDYACTFKFS